MGVKRRRKSSASLDEVSLISTQPKILYAKKKKPDSALIISIKISALAIGFGFFYYMYFHFDHFHFHLTHFYAHHMNDKHAQHTLGHKLHSLGNVTGAMHWFRKSANQGHAHSKYNLVASHLSGYPTDVKKGEVRELLEYAAKNGVEEASIFLQDICNKRPNYCDH